MVRKKKFRVKHCVICSKCWEGLPLNEIGGKNNKDNNVKYYNNYPKYGLTKQYCPDCEIYLQPKCMKGHSQPSERTNDCNYCVAVYGYTVNS
tara:strand:+ start:622 stop:897 length:276 start_codon:yes stop_codon:yes gene_type:complete